MRNEGFLLLEALAALAVLAWLAVALLEARADAAARLARGEAAARLAAAAALVETSRELGLPPPHTLLARRGLRVRIVAGEKPGMRRLAVAGDGRELVLELAGGGVR